MAQKRHPPGTISPPGPRARSSRPGEPGTGRRPDLNTTDTTTAAPPPMSAPAGETHRAGVCQTRHGVGPAPPITSDTTAIHPRGQPLRRAGEVPGPAPGHPFQSPELDPCRLVDDPRRIADRDPSLLHRQPHRRSGGTVFRQHPGGVGHCSPAHLQQRGRFPSSKRIVQICAISLWRTSGGRRRRELVGFGSMTASFSSRARQWKRPSPARGAALRKFFVGGRAGAQRAARQAVGPAVFPAPAFHGRSAH